MPKEILISVEPQEKRVACVDNGRLEEFYIERPQDKTIVNNIYKAKIEAILSSVGGAFVDIGLPKKGFLYLSEIEHSFEPSDARGSKPKEIKKGQEILVQVVKESFGTKGPRLSCGIGLAGRYLVAMPQESQIGVSRRIDDEERRRLRQLFAELKLPKNIGFIVRTAAAGKSKQELIRDARFLLKLWERLKRVIKRQVAPSLIYEEYDLTLRVIRDSFTDDVLRLLVDSRPEYYRIKRFMQSFIPHLSSRVEFYKGNDLFEDKGVEKQINRTFDSKVYLKSKVYIIIEPTEGLVVIDVNSGGFKKNLKQEEAAFKVNCEAAAEIAHQIRLRDLGGIIVIDFIDMEKEGYRHQVLEVLKKAMIDDRAKYDILGISQFGLVEMTRERIHNTVQTLSYEACPYCQGKGKIKSSLTMSIYALKELRRHLVKNKPAQEISLALNPAVVDEILKDRNTLRSMENRFKVKINLVPAVNLHREELKIS